jgi:hypothetical protein
MEKAEEMAKLKKALAESEKLSCEAKEIARGGWSVASAA